MFTKNIVRSMGKCLMLSVLLGTGFSFDSDAALTKDFYSSSSVLSSGNWVKIGVEKTGVYEISYATLKEMGFSDPSKVSVYGKGGRVLPESFVSNSGSVLLSDDISPVKVIHENSMLYFYGLGPEEITFESSSLYPTGGYFKRKSNNIYSKRGYYFLTDSRPIERMETKNFTAGENITKGVSYVYHELDSVQNTTGSGQLFWGEQVGLPALPRRKWNVSMPDAIAGSGVMECELYFSGEKFGSTATVSYGFENTSGYFSTPYSAQSGVAFYSPHQPSVAKIDVPGNTGSVFVEFKGDDMGDFSNLDFWVVSYQRNLPSMTTPDGKTINQTLLALPDVSKSGTGLLKLNNSASYVVLDVTDEAVPSRLSISQNGSTGTVGVQNSGSTPVIVVFDKSKPQLQISGYEKSYSKIANQNLHALKNQGADFIIITTPAFKQYADQIANLHRRYDNFDVVVATTEECYNEFSGGVPDPMAYRSFAKMLYLSNKKPKNILLLGPLYGDFRGLQQEHDPLQGIIAFQSPGVSTSRGAFNINDFYGMMNDQFRTDYYERNEVQIGVGILPVKFEAEARIMVEKISNYLQRDDHAYYLNRFTGIGGLGDDHTHDLQLRDIITHVADIDFKGTIYTPLAIDTYGNKEAQKKFFNKLNEGCSFFSYFGHGGERFLGKNTEFFASGDVYKLKNKILPLALFGGCQLTNTDRGYRGIGEMIVTDTPYGCIGAIVSARETWSAQNYEFFKQFFSCMFTDGSESNPRHNYSPLTIGEIYAHLKNTSTYNNELAYQLLCDPALVIPIINRPVTVKANVGDGAVELLPGEKFSMSGWIETETGEIDGNFNGKVVLRLNEPEKRITAGSIETGDNPGNLSYSYRDEQVGIEIADVVNGKFDINIHVPLSLSSFKGEKALLYFSAYDPKTKVGAGRNYTVPVGVTSSTNSEAADNVVPVIERLAFNDNDCSISLTVSDNVALNMSNNPLNKGLYLYVDGKERSEAHFIEPLIDGSRVAYSKNVPVDGLSYGTHSARLKVKDAAGNSSESEILFTYQPKKAKFTLKRGTQSNASSTMIEVEGDTPAAALLVVLSSTGEEVWRSSLKGKSIEWDHKDISGNQVAPGHYKAYIIETAGSGLRGHADPIDIPVI